MFRFCKINKIQIEFSTSYIQQINHSQYFTTIKYDINFCHIKWQSFFPVLFYFWRDYLSHFCHQFHKVEKPFYVAIMLVKYHLLLSRFSHHSFWMSPVVMREIQFYPVNVDNWKNFPNFLNFFPFSCPF